MFSYTRLSPIFLVAFLFCSTQTFAEETTGFTYLVVDQMYVLQNCKFSRAFAEHQKEILQKYDEVTNKEKEALGKKGQEIEAKVKSSKVRDANLEKMAQEEFQKAEKKFMDTYQQRQKSVSDAIEKANAKVTNTIVKVLNDYKKEKKVSVIFSRSGVLVCDDAKDSTEEILKRVDKELPTLDIKIPSPKE